MDRPSLTPSEKLAVVGSGLAVVGTFLPWISTSGVSQLGFYVDGFMALLFAIPVPGIVALWEWGTIQQVVTAALGALIAVVAGEFAFTFGTPLTGVGTYVVFVAGVIVAGAGVYGLIAARRASTGPAEDWSQSE